jgi:hypothetical protein
LRHGRQLVDLLGGVSRLLGQIAGFLSDDGKTAALFPGTSSFDGSVQGQQVRLQIRGSRGFLY